MIEPADERARSGGEGFADALTYAFADTARQYFGMLRVGLAGDAGSVLAVLFSGRDALAAVAQGGLAVPAQADWSRLELTADRLFVHHAVLAPLERWRVEWEGEHAHGFALEFEAVSSPVELGADEAVARVGGMQGYDQLCRVTGEVRTRSGATPIDGLGQRSRSWGSADWAEIEAVRSVAVWFAEQRGGILLSALRAAGAEGHHEDTNWAAVVEPSGDPVRVAEPRLSTTYDADGHQRRAGLELWIGEEDSYPQRAAGEVICGSSLNLGSLRLDLAFMRWHADGLEGVGRYDILRRA